jgi:hypothetical protein
MTDNEYLQKILKSQTLDSNGEEMKELRSRRDAVRDKLRDKYGSGPSIRYGGSKAKGTMIKEAYDLDVICYFANDDDSAGDTLQEIYDSVAETFEEDYHIERKPSAIRLMSKDSANFGEDYHTDVVPGRFVDEDRDDVFLYRNSGDKGRQKTNLKVHIDHVKDSGAVDEIRLLKLWRARNELSVRHFVLELLTIDLLKDNKDTALTDRLIHVWTEMMRDNIDDMKVEDPANPYGNDLSEIFNSSIKLKLSNKAEETLETIEKDGWEKVFGDLPDDDSDDSDDYSDDDDSGRANNSYPAIIVPPRDVRPSSSFGE